MLRAAIIVLALCSTTGFAVAQDVNEIEGLYTGQGEGDLTVDLTHIEDDRYAISFNTLVPMDQDRPGCAGGVDGEVLLSKKGGNFFAENEMYDPEGDLPIDLARYCEISLVFDGKGNLVIEEKDGCVGYHGAACGFSGELSHDAAGL